jgi:hypothetical protein
VSDEFRRLLDNGAGSPLHSVLEAGLHDQPSRRQLAQAARALGIGAAGPGGALPAAGAARTVHASLFSLAKWGATGVLLGGVALSPLLRESPSSVQWSSGHAVASARVATAFMPAPTPAASSDRTAAIVPSFARSVSTATPKMAHHAAPAIAKEAPTGSFQPLDTAPSSAPLVAIGHDHDLDAEVALLDAARSALKLGDSNVALTWLDRHGELKMPSLAAEATLLRVQALVAAGRSAEARSVVQAAVGGANASAYAQRLRKLVGVGAER